jgi:hypothetical protein
MWINPSYPVRDGFWGRKKLWIEKNVMHSFHISTGTGGLWIKKDTGFPQPVYTFTPTFIKEQFFI